MGVATIPDTNGALAKQDGPLKTPISFGERGMEIRTFSDLWRFAECIAASGLAPKNMDKPAAIVVAIQMGAEVGLSAMQAIQNIAVINGRPSMWGDAVLALCQGSQWFDHEAFEEAITGSGDKMSATCTVRRLPGGKPCVRTFDVADAKLAGLWGKAGPWTQYPKRMLQLRARGFALRDTFPDILRGINVAEEAQDIIEVKVSQNPKVKPLAELVAPQGTPGPQAMTADEMAKDIAESEAADMFAGSEPLSRGERG